MKKLRVLLIPILLFALVGCGPVKGTIKSASWFAESKGDRYGTCRIVVKNTVDSDNRLVGTRYVYKKHLTRSKCYSRYTKGSTYHW